jgi:hypothetical protein
MAKRGAPGWRVEQYFQWSKDDLGLDHFEGRSWRGFHHHLALSAVAYLFILVVYLRAKKTSGVTWETVFKTIRPWLVRSTGFCHCCGSKFEGICDDTT